jgi:hypothetical protein
MKMKIFMFIKVNKNLFKNSSRKQEKASSIFLINKTTMDFSFKNLIIKSQ